MSNRTFVELVRLMRVAQVREQETRPKGLWPSVESMGMNKAYKALRNELEQSVDEEIRQQQSSGRKVSHMSQPSGYPEGFPKPLFRETKI